MRKPPHPHQRVVHKPRLEILSESCNKSDSNRFLLHLATDASRAKCSYVVSSHIILVTGASISITFCCYYYHRKRRYW